MKCLVAMTAALLVLGGCDQRNDSSQTALEALQRGGADKTPVPGIEARPVQASAKLETAPGTNLTGAAEFRHAAEGVHVQLTISGAPPGKHGVHVHEKGDCSDIAGKSMGAHFAPRGHQHGLPVDPERHLGDLGNIVVDDSGRGQLVITASDASLSSNDSMSFLGKAIVVHEKEDTGQGTSGESGQPIACGVIKSG